MSSRCAPLSVQTGLIACLDAQRRQSVVGRISDPSLLCRSDSECLAAIATIDEAVSFDRHAYEGVATIRAGKRRNRGGHVWLLSRANHWCRRVEASAMTRLDFVAGPDAPPSPSSPPAVRRGWATCRPTPQALQGSNSHLPRELRAMRQACRVGAQALRRARLPANAELYP